MNIQKIKTSSVDAVLAVYQSCVLIHKKAGFNQWDESYPNKETALNDINKGWLYGLFESGNKLIAIVSITEDEPEEYLALKWSDQSTKHCIVHRLCVSEANLRKGYAKDLMIFAETHAVKEGFNSIRLDTLSLNTAALVFYKKLDYKEVGKVNFPKRVDSDYTCFEKVL